MTIKPSDLWRWDGTVHRGPYVLIGCVLTALKYNLDRFVTAVAYDRPWSIFSYLMPAEARVTDLTEDDLGFYITLVVTALPFIWTGVVMSVRRLRATELPVWLVCLFFAPLINLLFFVVLSILPTRSGQAPGATESHRLLDRVIPRHRLGSIAMGMLLTLPPTVGLTLFGVEVLATYGWGLFIGIPFCLSLSSVLIHGYHTPRPYWECLVLSLMATAILGLTLVALAIEGVLCIIMATPLGVPLGLVGATLGWALQSRPLPGNDTPALLAGLVISLPVLMGAEHLSPEQPRVIALRTVMDIQAPPDHVWQQVVSFGELPDPEPWILRTGIAYPIRARMLGKGVGAERHCVFTTGAFVEPITVWDEPWLLKFSVRSQPRAMREWSPWPGISPPHIDSFLVSQGGQFRLVPLPDGGTRLEATTWYHHAIWPANYWQVWSDWILHQIHLRVLRHIKRQSEDR